MKRRIYQKQELEEVVNKSFSIREVLVKLQIIPAGGNYHTMKKYLLKYDIDISHFKGKGWNKDRKFKPKRPLQEYLSNEFPIQSYKLKQRLISEGIFQHQCSSCNKTEWLNQPIPLELDHIDGNNQNNNLENLRLLCPNCHAFTPTYRGRNISKT